MPRNELSVAQRLQGMIGLAMRAGKLIIGTEQVCLALPKRGRVRLVLVSEGASEATVSKVTRKCEFYRLPCRVIGIDGGTLGDWIGKSYAPMCIGVADEGFAAQIIKILGSPDDGSSL